MKKFICLLTLLVLASGCIFANPMTKGLLFGGLIATAKEPAIDAPEDNVFNKYDSAIGISYFPLVAEMPCLSYQEWITPDFGYSLAFGASYSPNSYSGSNYEFSFFSELQWALYTASTSFMDTRLYAWILGGVDTRKFYGSPSTNASFGAGFGFDICELSHISFPIEFGYIVQGPDDFSVSLSGHFGLRYRF